MVGATIVVVIIYSLFSSLFNKAKEMTSKTSHIVEPNVMDNLDARNKDSLIKGIDYCIDIKEYKEAYKLCEIYIEHHIQDQDVTKRINYLKDYI